MGETANYFKREKYITRRLSLLVLGATAILVPINLALTRGRIAAHAFTSILIAVVIGIAIAVVFILRRARVKFPKSNVADDSPLDEPTRKKLRRRIHLLEFLVAVYALILLYGLWQAPNSPWLGILAGIVVNLLMQIALVKTIRRLKKKLKPATDTISL
jgi:uncharacterized membrane protein YfcA